MSVFIAYLLKLSISLAIVWLFYQFVLRKLTFYNSNRWYLLGYTLLCFLIPFIDISPVLQRNEWANSTPVSWVPVIENYRVYEIDTAAASDFFTTWNSIMLVLVAGMLIMFLRLLFQLISFRRMMRKAKAIPGERVNVFQVDEDIIPFSFGNSIFLNQHLHTTEELQEIIRHEFVHVKQKHSIDIIWGELLVLFNWYNPFAWLLKKAIRQNLEFIADNKVLENGIDKKQYQYLLLKVIGNNQFSIAPKFNFSSLKKRIAMMNKLKTAKLHLVRFLFILPLLAVILLSFRKQIGDSFSQNKNKEKEIAISGDFTDTVPEVMELNDKGYYIDIKGKGGDCIVLVKDKNRKEVERVLLTKWKENQKHYDNLYGKILPPPPAEPPFPPTPPVPMELPDFVKRINVNNDHAEIWLKDGKKETYNLKVPSEKAAFEKKYGEILPTPPEPPVKVLNPGLTEFLERNPGVKNLGWVFDNVRDNRPIVMYVIKKDGSEEKYKLDDPADKARAEKKYGELPLPLSTPMSMQPPTNVYELNATQELNRANIGEHLEIDDKKASVRLTNGTVEEYNLANDAEKKKFETRYGKIIEIGEPVEGVEMPVKAISTLEGHTVLAPLGIGGDGGLTFLNDEGNIISGEEEILVTITKKTTQQQLEGFVKQMKERGIQLKFDNTNYDNGILVHIAGTMKIKDSNSNFSATDFNKLILSTIKNGDRTYIQVRVADKKVVI